MPQNPGVWAHNYGCRDQESKRRQGRFRVQVVYSLLRALPASEVVVESFENLSTTTPDPQGRYVGDVINKQSNFVDSVIVATGTTTASNTTLPLPSPKLSGHGQRRRHSVAASTEHCGSGGAFEICVNRCHNYSRSDRLVQPALRPGRDRDRDHQHAGTYCEGRRVFSDCRLRSRPHESVKNGPYPTHRRRRHKLRFLFSVDYKRRTP